MSKGVGRSLGLVEAGWASYAEHVLPADAPAVQVQETRRAFYGGAAHLLGAFSGIGNDEVSEDEGVRALEAVQAELQQFVRDVQRGRR